MGPLKVCSEAFELSLRQNSSTAIMRTFAKLKSVSLTDASLISACHTDVRSGDLLFLISSWGGTSFFLLTVDIIIAKWLRSNRDQFCFISATWKTRRRVYYPKFDALTQENEHRKKIL